MLLALIMDPIPQFFLELSLVEALIVVALPVKFFRWELMNVARSTDLVAPADQGLFAPPLSLAQPLSQPQE